MPLQQALVGKGAEQTLPVWRRLRSSIDASQRASSLQFVQTIPPRDSFRGFCRQRLPLPSSGEARARAAWLPRHSV